MSAFMSNLEPYMLRLPLIDEAINPSNLNAVWPEYLHHLADYGINSDDLLFKRVVTNPGYFCPIKHIIVCTRDEFDKRVLELGLNKDEQVLVSKAELKRLRDIASRFN